jgi:endonuclease/exonuclease/phosphatase family metal-dependent hydrolase
MLPLIAMSASLLVLAGCARSRAARPNLMNEASTIALGAARDPDPELIGRNDRLSVLSFNMHHKDRPRDLALMAERLRSDVPETPDFILLQEVVFDRAARKGEENTAEVLANELDYQCRGAQRTSDREGVAIISRYRFDYFDECHHQAQTNRLLLGFNRVSVMGEFQVPGVGRVRVVNVHYTNWAFEEHVRRQQLAETLRWTAHRQAQVPADVIILGGDFNIEPDWDELDVMRDLRATGGIEYRDNNDPRIDTFGSVGDASKRVDYIFMAVPTKRTALTHLSEQTLWANGLPRAGSGGRVHLSDHLPLLQEYQVSGVTAGLASAE